MIESTNATRIQNWLTDHASGIRLTLANVLPASWLSKVDRELTELQNASQQQLEVKAAMLMLGRYSQLVAAYNELRSLVASINIEQLRQGMLYEIAVLEGDIKRELTTLRGAFKSELAALEGQNALEISALENEGRLILAQEIIPLDRQGKIDVAEVKGQNDAEIATLDSAMKLALANVRGAFDVKMAGIDAKAILAESEVTVAGIRESAVVDSLGILREAEQEKYFILNASELKSSFTLQSATQKGASIDSNASLSASYSRLINANDVLSTNTLSQLRIASNNLETDVRVGQIAGEGLAQRDYERQQTLDANTYTLNTADAEVKADADALIAKLGYAAQLVTAEVNSERTIGESELLSAEREGLAEIAIKGLTHAIDFSARYTADAIENTAVVNDAYAEASQIQSRSELRRGQTLGAAQEESNYILDIAHEKILHDRDVTTLKIDTLNNKQIDAKELLLRQQGQETEYIRLSSENTIDYIKTQADDGWSETIETTDNLSKAALDVAAKERGIAVEYAGWAQTVTHFVNSYIIRCSEQLAKAGKYRVHTRYNIRDDVYDIPDSSGTEGPNNIALSWPPVFDGVLDGAIGGPDGPGPNPPGGAGGFGWG